MVDQVFENYNYSYDEPAKQGLTIGKTVQELRHKMMPLRFGIAARNISKELEFQGGENVLEIGSGLGLLGEAIQKETGGKLNYVGVELALGPAKRSSEKEILPIQADAVDLSFGDESFDALITTDVLEHIPNAEEAVGEMNRVLKTGGKAFVVIADPSEGRFTEVHDHIDRSGCGTDVKYWESLFQEQGFKVLSKSLKYRNKDWRKIFNLPILTKFKDGPGFACTFNPINRPGTYILQKE